MFCGGGGLSDIADAWCRYCWALSKNIAKQLKNWRSSTTVCSRQAIDTDRILQTHQPANLSSIDWITAMQYYMLLQTRTLCGYCECRTLARVVCGPAYRGPSIPLLQSLHWLPINCYIVTSLPKVIWEQGRVAAAVPGAGWHKGLRIRNVCIVFLKDRCANVRYISIRKQE